jgi:YHYH protein/Secretion system C-terminal sorting domain
MRKKYLLLVSVLAGLNSMGQTNPAIIKWLQNTTQTGSYYASGNPNSIPNNILVNCQEVSYSANFAYIKTAGVPAYPTGPFQDGNPSNATNQNAIFKIPLNPVQNTGTPTATNGGNIGVFINGVALFDYRDGVAWNNTTQTLCGGPGRAPCPGGPMATQAWNRDAVVAERAGFDCAKGHPAMGNYHHHQNPSAFKLDLDVISSICNLYDADGLYAIDSTQHSPLIGFAYDGFPIYGAYGYKNADGGGGITRIRSGYQLRNISTRTNGPAVSTTYPLGYFREDYEFIAHPGQEEYLDEHNGRICTTPDYPDGIYCYFATVDADWNSAYPYVVGPTFYGVSANRKVASITEAVTIYTPVVLPVNPFSFTGRIDRSTAILNWQTNSEINSSHFIIERSTDGQHFETAGNVPAAGNTTAPSNYQFTDQIISTGILYYRIKNVDRDGKFSYSAIIRLQLQDLGSAFNLLPNPASDLVAIQYKGLLEENTTVQMYNMEGKMLLQTTINKGQTIAYFNTETLYAGTYVVRIINSKTNESHRVIVAR